MPDSSADRFLGKHIALIAVTPDAQLPVALDPDEEPALADMPVAGPDQSGILSR